VREWLARGSRAPRDAVWIADGHWSKQWAPVSPLSGKLDAYRWMQPKETLAGPVEEPPRAQPPAHEPPAPPALEVQPAPAPEVLIPAETPPATVADPQASEETTGEAAREPAEQAKTPARKNFSAQPVIFPLPTPPDDPGPKKQEAETRLY
jgi:HemY protein